MKTGLETSLSAPLKAFQRLTEAQIDGRPAADDASAASVLMPPSGFESTTPH
jgi:hypothetical protein